MNKQETHVVTGMSRDMSVTRFNPNLVVDARNIRITTRDDKATLLVVTNEKGPKEIELSGGNIIGIALGYAVIDNSVIIFTTDEDDTVVYDYIFKVDFVNENSVVVNKLFKGQLGFSVDYPIETTVVIENENIKKVYWVDGINQPRMININKEYQDDDNDAFDFCQKVEFNHYFTVEKNTTGGEFPVGTIQYCFSYFNLNGQETNLIETSPLYYLSPVDRGLPADSRCTNSFLIKIGNADTSFDYVRLYSIIRTSENATPNCRIVGDYKITDNITIVDNGTIGSTIDPTALYFIGGKSIVAGTLDQKDNTLFLGNIETNVPKLKALSYDNATLKETQYNNTYSVESISFDMYGDPIDETEIRTPTMHMILDNREFISKESFYSYPINNKKNSQELKGFKTNENYRLGFIAQYKTGEWSDVIWVGDATEEEAPGLHWFNDRLSGALGQSRIYWDALYKKPGFKTVIPEGITSILRSSGFRKVAPVVCFPNDAERLVVAQGILAGTVYNVSDRGDNSPHVQADWRFRVGYSWKCIDHEIQCNEPAKAPQYPTYSDYSIDAFVQNFGNQYYRDPSILTFHSPDIEFTEDLKDSDFEGLKLRIVGFSNLGFDSFDSVIPETVADSYIDIDTPGISTDATIVPFKLGSAKNWRIPSAAINRDVLTPESLSHIGYKDMSAKLQGTTLLDWVTYIWHRTGSLNDDSMLSKSDISDGKIRSALYKRKCISEIKYGLTTFFQKPFEQRSVDCPSSFNINITTPKLFDSDQIGVCKLQLNTDTQALYYGNIDKVVLPTFKNISGLYDWSDGYPIEYSGSVSANGTEDHPGSTTNRHSSSSRNDITPAVSNVTKGKDPVRIKYKSTKHLVIPLKEDDGVINQFGELPEQGITKMFWHSNNVTFNSVALESQITDIDFPYHGLNNSVLIGELYRDFTPDQLAARFGGTSEEALATNKWVMCGDPVSLEYGQSATLLYKEGDTYIGRYDCLKTYPFTQEDQNSIVSIYSTELESRVNLDLRYDKNRGLQDNTLITPQNFNLFNRAGYDQTNQFFTYQSLNTDRYNVDYFPNMVTWSLEKSFGEDVDTWTSMPLTSTLNLDGDKGGVTELVTWNDNIFAFQKDGFAQLLFNSRVQIPVSDGQPIEITNGLKMSGKRYISENIGCFNKWSVCTTPLGIYFIDDVRKALYNFNGQINNLSQQKGFETWMSEVQNTKYPWTSQNTLSVRTYYDVINRDLYFSYGDYVLTYSEKLNNFISFLDYPELLGMFNIGNKFYILKYDNHYFRTIPYEMWAGDYNYFFDDFKPFWLTFVSNTDPTVDKVYNTLDWRSTTYENSDGDSGVLNPLVTFDALRVWNDYQDTMQQVLVNDIGTSSNLRKKFNVFRAIIPRDKRAELTESLRDRIRSPWVYIQLSKTIPNKDLMVFNDLTVNFFE